MVTKKRDLCRTSSDAYEPPAKIRRLEDSGTTTNNDRNSPSVPEDREGEAQVPMSDESSLVYSKLRRKYKLKDIEIRVEDIGDRIDIVKANLMNYDDLHEVEEIVDKKIHQGVVMYSVKWKGWDPVFNTWEPASNLTNCSELLLAFESGKTKLIDRFKTEINYSASVSEMEELMSKLTKAGMLKNYRLPDMSDVHSNINTLLKRRGSMNQRVLRKVKSALLMQQFHYQRSAQISLLKDWENEIRTITKNKPFVKVENNVDLEGPPQEFLYVDDYIPGKGVSIPEDPPIGCECISCEIKSNCCGKQSGGSFAYTTAKRIRVPLGTPIYECNKRCRCDESCMNRVVQHGASVKLCIFRTSTGCGWGVKALQYIKKGTFVTEYVGEVITNDEAEKRGKEYDAAGRTYLFDLDYNETEQCPYTVDAATYGNISHFINHSCDPNLAVYGVWINCLDPNLPKLGLFATRNILRSEEITFDYMCQSLRNTAVVTPKKENFQAHIPPVSSPRQRLELPMDNESVESRARCKCQAAKCRQYLF